MVLPRTHRCRRRGRFFCGVSRVGPAGYSGMNQSVVVLTGFFVPSVVSAWNLGAWVAGPGSSDSHFAVVGPAALVRWVADVWRGRPSGAQVCCIILT